MSTVLYLNNGKIPNVKPSNTIFSKIWYALLNSGVGIHKIFPATGLV